MHPLKRLWLKAWPKLLVTTFGTICYVAAASLPTAHQGLMQGIAVNLISIPIIFLFYQIWSDRSQKKLYEHIYREASNEMDLVMDEAKREVQGLLQGVEVYIRGRPLVVDDSNVPEVGLSLYDKASIEEDEEGVRYLTADDHEYLFYEDDEEDLFSFDKGTIVPRILDTWYVGYQVFGFGVDKIVSRIDSLLRNAFVMERLGDREATIIVALHQSLRALHAFMDQHDDLFLSTGAQFGGLIVESHAAHIRGWFIVDLVLQVCDAEQRQYRETLDSSLYPAGILPALPILYIVNPDYYIVFSDLIHEVLDCVSKWREQIGHDTYIDLDNGRIGVI